MEQGQADREYRETLAPGGNEVAFAAAQDAAAVDLLKAWQDVAAAITAPTETFYDTALPNGDPKVIGSVALPTEDSARLLRQARFRFRDLLREDVIQKWAQQENPDGLATDLVDGAAPFIKADMPKVLSLLGKPADPQSMAIYPGAGSTRQDVQEFARHLPAGIHSQPAEAAFRATVMHEYYGIPLEAIPGIVHTSGVNHSLEKAIFTNWRTWSRKNEDGWLPISPEQRQRLHKYRQLLAVSVVMGLLRVEAQRLRLSDYPASGFGDETYRELPPVFDAAARKWALDGTDTSGRSLDAMEGVLANRITAIRAPHSQGPRGFLKMLNQRLQYAGGGMTGWNQKVIEALVVSYCMNDEELAKFMTGAFGPTQEARDIMYYQVGQMTVAGPCAEVGFHCVNIDIRCPGFLGADEGAAEQKGWKCPTCLTEYHNARSTAKPDWFQQAATLKGPSAPGPIPTAVGTAPPAVASNPYTT